jgi:hypothetical protein
VVLSASTTVFATGDTYLLGGETQTVQEGDLFGTAFKGLMPGDDKTLEITLTNRSGFTQDVFLMAQAETEEAETLIDLLEMKLRLNGALLYWGNVAGAATIAESDAAHDDMYGWMALGRFTNGSSAALEVEIIVPTSLGNEFQAVMDSVVWTLHSERVHENDPDDPDEEDIWGDDDDGDELVTIEDFPVPLADLPKTGGALEA